MNTATADRAAESGELETGLATGQLPPGAQTPTASHSATSADAADSTDAASDRTDVLPDNSASDLDDVVVSAMLRTSRVMLGVAARSLHAAPQEVTLPQFRTLVILSQGRSMRLAELAESLNVSPSTATRMCDRLVRKGFVERSRQVADKREVSLVAGAVGMDVVATVMRYRQKEIRTLSHAIPPQRRESLVDSLNLLCEIAGEASDEMFPWGWSDTAAH